MRDPRIIEIELLTEIDRATHSGNAYRYHRSNPMGGDERQQEGAFLNLAFEGAIMHADGYEFGFSQLPPTLVPSVALDIAAKKAVDEFITRAQVRVQITQRGRLRLYRLRDELLNRDRVRDDFGILWSKRHFIPDLEVKLRFHPFPEPFSVLVLDVDRLKDLNTAFGHADADDILKGIFHILRDVVAPNEAYRLGGDEAGAILPGVDQQRAHVLAEEIRRTVHRTFERKAFDQHTPTVSIGAGTITALSESRALYEEVDTLCAHAKSRRNSVECCAVRL